MTTPIIRPDLKAIREKALGKVPHGAGTDPVCLNLPEVLALLDYTEALIAALREARPYLLNNDPYTAPMVLFNRIDALLPPEPQG